MAVNPGYKLTEVGVIPADWGCERICESAAKGANAIVGGPFGSDLVSADYAVAGVPVIRGQNMSAGTVSGDFVFVSSRKAKSLSANLAHPGDLVFTQRGTLGQVAIVPSDKFESYLVSQSQMKVSLDLERHDPCFLYQYFASRAGQKQIAASAIQTGVPHTNLGILRTYCFPAPLLAEQRAIAAALSDVDALLRGLDRLIAKKRDLKHAAMQQLLTGRIRVDGFGPTKRIRRWAYGEIPDDWGVRPLKTISIMNGRIGWQGLKQEEFTDNPDDPFLITGMNFKDGKIRWEEVYHIPDKRYREAPPIQLKVGDVLMTKDGTIGKLLYVDGIPYPGMASLNSHLLVFRPMNGQYVPKFLFYQLASPSFVQHIELHKSGSTFFGLTQQATGKYPVILPSVREQAAIARTLSAMDEELSALEVRREKTRALKQGMMQELLTGKTRLVAPSSKVAAVDSTGNLLSTRKRELLPTVDPS